MTPPHETSTTGAVDERLLFRNTMRIEAGHLDEYRAAIERAVDFAEREGPQLMVDVFIDEGTMRADSLQLYADSASVLRHWQIADPYIEGVMQHCTVERFEVYGNPSPEVREGIEGADFPVELLPRLAGFLRGGIERASNQEVSS
jgi:hypothetical protein